MASYNQGAQVEHQTFGLGTVISHTEERIVIKFDDHGEKKFVTSMVLTNLKKSDRQPPAEKRARARKAKSAPDAAAAGAEGEAAAEKPKKRVTKAKA
ncbi:MAG TPA: hypothetical protein VHC90_08305 [Bryobacteraceae bacterium]|nr:hypothetical protein [Bryobacteraceae bacterium]